MNGSVIDLQNYGLKGYSVVNTEHEEAWIRIKKRAER